MRHDQPTATASQPVSDERRLSWTRAIIASGCAAGLALAPRLWCGPRVYPPAPVWHGLPDLPSSMAVLLYGLMFALLLGVIVWRRAAWPIAAFVLLAGVWTLWDQSRWQPWFYQYVCMLACLGWACWRNTEDSRRGGLVACRLIVAGTYLWSGLQKANVSFATVVYPWLVEPCFGRELTDLQASLAYTVPVVEAGVGLMLLVPRLRMLAVMGVALMHGTILLSIGPWGHDWNTVVWPWNIAMPLATFVLFAKSGHESAGILPISRWSGAQWLATVAFLLLPALSFWGWWDAYLSASLYSGNTLKGYLEISGDVRQRLPEESQAVCENAGLGRYRLPLSDWSMQDINVPAYPAERVFNAIFHQFQRDFAQPGDEVTGILLTRPAWRSTERQERRVVLPSPAAP